jgi:signal transduction histidine kinase
VPDWVSNLISALKLSGRIIAGLFLACLVALALNGLGVIQLAGISVLALPSIILAAVLFGALSLTALGGLFYDRWYERHKTTLLAARREVRRNEGKRERAEFEAKALARLDYLSALELRFVANCLRNNEQSFTASVYSPHIKNLITRGLVTSPGGTHHQEHWPFMIEDFAWEYLLAHKVKFMARDYENRRREAAEEKAQRERARY